MLLIFLIAAVDAVRLLREMRVENKVLRDASLERSRRLASIRSYVLLSENYMGDYLFDADQERSAEHLEQLQDAWSRMLANLASYRTVTIEEAVLLNWNTADKYWTHPTNETNSLT